VTGEYSVLQPDGCVRNVKYTAGPRGFFPEVTYVGNCDPKSYIAPVVDEVASGRNAPNENDDIPSARMAPVASSSVYQNAQCYAAAWYLVFVLVILGILQSSTRTPFIYKCVSILFLVLDKKKGAGHCLFVYFYSNYEIFIVLLFL